MTKEPTNSANLITLRERPWWHCPQHDEYVAKDEFIWAWCPACGAEDRIESERRNAPLDEAAVRTIVRDMLRNGLSTEAVQLLDSPPDSVVR